MIKFSAFSHDGKKLVGIGLSEMNLQKLREGCPIKIGGDEVDVLDTEILIFYGKTEKEMHEKLKGFIDPETETHIDPRMV
jgi:hypothetical protein